MSKRLARFDPLVALLKMATKETETEQLKERNTYVFYHRNCNDGIAAAWAAWLVLGNKAEYMPSLYDEPVPDIAVKPDTTIYILDFSFPLAVIRAWTDQGAKVKLIDHHKTAYERYASALLDEYLANINCAPDSYFIKTFSKWELKLFPSKLDRIAEDLGYVAPIFDMKKSAAVLAWEYFHPDEEMPRVIKYVQDRDLWQWKYADSKAALEGMRATGRLQDFSFWTEMTFDENLDAVISIGTAIINYQKTVINETLYNPKMFTIINLHGHLVAVYNTTTLMSEMGSEFCTAAGLLVDYSLSYFIQADGSIKLSLRSRPGSTVNVEKIAKTYYNGGGHFNAAGGYLSRAEGLRWLNEIYTYELYELRGK